MMFGYNSSDYELKSELATCCGGIGTVYLGQHKPSGEHVTIKRYKMDKLKEEYNIITVYTSNQIYGFYKM